MVKIKKVVKSLTWMKEQLDEQMEMAESFGVEMIRVRTCDKLTLNMFNEIDGANPQKLMGFDQVAFDKRGNKRFFSGCLMLYPCPDFYHYGYLPVTKNNLFRLAAILRNGLIKIDDIDSETEDLPDRNNSNQPTKWLCFLFSTKQLTK